MIDPCRLDRILYITKAELYDQSGVKLRDLRILNDEIKIENENPNNIRIIKAETRDQQKSKTVITD